MSKRLVCLSVGFGGDQFIRDMFRAVVPYYDDLNLNHKDIVLFEGGTDISPSLYGESPGLYTQNPNKNRDELEVKVWKRAQEVGAHCFGICRGAQLFTALSGGKLIQHITNHHGTHRIQTSDGKVLQTSSVHHQMMAPGEINHKLLAWSLKNKSKVYLNGKDEDCFELLAPDLNLEPEAVWYPDTRSLGVQGHPEFLPDGHEFQGYCREIIETYLFKENL